MKPNDVHKLAVDRGWDEDRRIVAHLQAHMAEQGFDVGPVDGLVGPQTEYALQEWERQLNGLLPSTWRDTTELPDDDKYAEMVETYGEPGDWSNFQKFLLPYPMKLAWDLGTTITHVTMHKKVGEEAMHVLRRVVDVYDTHEIRQHGFDLFGGAVSVRKKRGGSTWSTHAWGIALDFDPVRNQLRWDSSKAYLAREACAAFMDLWEQAGWVSLGRSLNYDWMHVQKAAI
jgi:hypothetical protein